SSSSLDKKPATSAWVIPRSSASFRKNRSDGDHHSSRLCFLVVMGRRVARRWPCLVHESAALTRLAYLFRARENLVSWRGPKKKAQGEWAPCRVRRQSRVFGRELLTRRAALEIVPSQRLRRECLSRVRRFLDLETMPQEPTGRSHLVKTAGECCA